MPYQSPPPGWIWPKRKLIVLCDGPEVHMDRFTDGNIGRLEAAFLSRYLDDCDDPARRFVHISTGKKCREADEIDYASGVTFYEGLVHAYLFISLNYIPGDEIYLFGFSTGAYMARTLCDIIGAIGILEHLDRDQIWDILPLYQRWRTAVDDVEREIIWKELAPWTSSDSITKTRISTPFSVTCLALFGAADLSGITRGLLRKPKKKLFGCPDPKVGEHVEYVFQAFPLHEKSRLCHCNRLQQTNAGKEKGQILRQCWFTGDRLDIGGAYERRDNADLVLFWVLGNLSHKLNIDLELLKKKLQPTFHWGKCAPTSRPRNKRKQKYSFSSNDTVHASVMQQADQELVSALRSSNVPVEPLTPEEEELKSKWESVVNNRVIIPSWHRIIPKRFMSVQFTVVPESLVVIESDGTRAED